MLVLLIFELWFVVTVIINDCVQIFKCNIKNIIDDQLIELPPVRNFGLSILHPALYYGLTVLAAICESFAQGFK